MGKRICLAVTTLVSGVQLAGCGDEGGPAEETVGQLADETDASVLGGDAGSGTFSVDRKSLEVKVFVSGVGPGETRNDDVQCSFRGGGVDDGGDFTLDGAIITNDASRSERSNPDMRYDDDPAPLACEGAFGSNRVWTIDGKDVSLTGSDYVDQNDESVGPGNFEGVCP